MDALPSEGRGRGRGRDVAPAALRLCRQDFALALSVFAPDAPYEQKLKLAFDMFDYDGDRAINRQDLEVRASAASAASVRQLHQLRQCVGPSR